MRPAQQALMRERYQLGIDEALVFSYLLIGVTVALVWSEASQTGTIAWAILLGVICPLPKIIHNLDVPFKQWFRLAFIAEVLNGTAWGAVTWLALPSSDLRQALLCVIVTGVMVAASLAAAQFRSLSLGYLVPYAALSITGYLFSGGLFIAAIFLSIAFIFSVLMAAEHREVHQSLVALIMKNSELLEELEQEHDALTKANQQLDAQAWTDSLTGLANRPAMATELTKRLEASATSGNQLSIAFLDLNGFKQINDTWGHHTGDQLLIAVARRLLTTAPEHALVYRLGGDEFVVLAPNPPQELGKIIADAFDSPLPVGDRELHVDASIGVATADGTTRADDVLRHADRAVYRHKHNADPSARWQVFDDSMRDELAKRRDQEKRIHGALNSGDITPWFQPVVDMHSGEIVCSEALARWVDGDTVHSAGEFLDVLTEAGLLGKLTELTFEAAFELQSTVTAAGRPRPRVCINVSPQQLEHVLTNRTDAGDLESLAIEITEETPISNPEHVTELLERARRLGAKVLVDDFGIGYSSLARTAALPIDGLKIDQSFVATLLTSAESSAVVSTIVDLASQLDLHVIAEGIETEAQMAKLIELGVSLGQGYLFSRAVEAAQVTSWLIDDHRLLPNAAKAA